MCTLPRSKPVLHKVVVNLRERYGVSILEIQPVSAPRYDERLGVLGIGDRGERESRPGGVAWWTGVAVAGAVGSVVFAGYYEGWAGES